MHDKLTVIAGGLALLLATGTRAQDRPLANPEKTALPATKQATKQATKPAPRPGATAQDRRPPASAQEKEQGQEQRRTAAHLAAAYPRTRALLGYLERQDRAVYESLLAHGIRITRRREAAALRLAREHHPELARLIARSKRESPRAYERAIRALIADHARLQRARQAGPGGFEAAIAEWKVQSRARFLIAQLQPGNRAELMPQIERLLAAGEQARRRQVEGQINRLREQIQRLQERLDRDPAETVQRQLRVIENRMQKPSRRPGDSTRRKRK